MISYKPINVPLDESSSREFANWKQQVIDTVHWVKIPVDSRNYLIWGTPFIIAMAEVVDLKFVEKFNQTDQSTWVATINLFGGDRTCIYVEAKNLLVRFSA